MKSRVFAFAIALVLAFGAINTITAQDEVMTNDEVISLTKSGSCRFRRDWKDQNF